MVSVAWSHIRQHVGWGRPRRTRRSTVQHLLWATSHIKKRHLGGVQVFQTFSHGPNQVEPRKNPSYADLAEY